MKSQQQENSQDVWLFVFVGTGEDIISRKQEALEKAQRAEEEEHSTFEDYARTFEEQQQGTEGNTYQRARNFALSKFSQGYLTNRYYLSPNVVKAMNDAWKKTGALFYANVLQGVGTNTINPINMKSGKPVGKSPFSRIRGYVTGAGEKENINYVMELLKDAEGDNKVKKRSLPKRIILNGHSRGSAATIELARAIYLKYGDEIKIAINISDPVPGPLRHKESKMVIPPNVDSLVITYAEQPMGSPLIDKMFNPLDLDHIYFDPAKTMVTTTTFPVSHMLTSDETKEYRLTIQSESGAQLVNNEIRLNRDTSDGLQYEVIGPNGYIKHTIPWRELPSDFPHEIDDILKNEKKYLPIILNYTSEMNHTKTITQMTENAMESINIALVKEVAKQVEGKDGQDIPIDSVKDEDNIDFVINDAIRRNPNEAKEKGIRKGRNFILATEIKSKGTELNDDQSVSLRSFHEKLRAKLYGKEMDLSQYEGRSRTYVSNATENVKVENVDDRKRMLETIYRFGKMTVKSPAISLQNDKHYQEWRATPFILKDKDKLIDDLNVKLDELKQVSKDNPKVKKRNISALEYAISVITKLDEPNSNDDYAYYYLQLRDLRSQTKKYLQPSLLHATMRLFALPQNKNKYQKIIDDAISKMLYPSDIKQPVVEKRSWKNK